MPKGLVRPSVTVIVETITTLLVRLMVIVIHGLKPLPPAIPKLTAPKYAATHAILIALGSIWTIVSTAITVVVDTITEVNGTVRVVGAARNAVVAT